TNIAFRGVLDGKQKLSTIVGFMNNEFPDQNGKYFKDFSKESKNKFLNFMNQNFVLMSQETTDNDACQIMIDVNDTGVPVSKEHINFLKSLIKENS
ncbi:hypothetical protein KY334_03345, partial [Candidatus Woesearchaeota archaeon]|nr:hypothetical protein [Candidatus Woesearchaeota archaeon]